MHRLSALLLLSACARATAPSASVASQGAAATITSAEHLQRCRELADSTSRLATRALPRASNASPGRLDAYPRDIRDRAVVRASYRVRPDGSGDSQSLVITGSGDADFRRALERALEQMRAQPARREGCPVWSQAEYLIKAEIRVRRSG